jgi:hypothetical protein
MTDTHPLELPRPWLPFVVATYIGLGILFVGVGVVQYGLVALSGYYAETLPRDYAVWQLPLLIPALAFGVAIQAAVIATAFLVGRVRSGRILEPGAVRGVDVLIGAITVAGLLSVALVVLLRLADAVPPGVMLVLVLGGAGLGVLDLLLLVLRSLLKRAIVMRAELDEVV